MIKNSDAARRMQRSMVTQFERGYSLLELIVAVIAMAGLVFVALEMWRTSSETASVNRSIANITRLQEAIGTWQRDHPSMQPPDNADAYLGYIEDPDRMMSGEGRDLHLRHAPSGEGLTLSTYLNSQSHARDLALYFRGSVSPVLSMWHVSLGISSPMPRTTMFDHTLVVDSDSDTVMNRPIEFDEEEIVETVEVGEDCFGFAIGVDAVGRILTCIENEDEDSEDDAEEDPRDRSWSFVECTRSCTNRLVPNEDCDTCICNLEDDDCPGELQKDDTACACVCRRECDAGEMASQDCSECVPIETPI